eukprot:gnl/TRDRNA2_/TRDRNA2_171051_c0_seq5.p1 gnl/TRDRNA2_/TRDRNA2_171051_c0~~gnl/TRDRNA2_/TRDRNA2_171051_c0_seq5.p1  ORF type:complete len:250 (+),score=28.64 gnl/TRDRNA2_/TRDRNA2_171051_c0_seq5:151-900(+)
MFRKTAAGKSSGHRTSWAIPCTSKVVPEGEEQKNMMTDYISKKIAGNHSGKKFSFAHPESPRVSRTGSYNYFDAQVLKLASQKMHNHDEALTRAVILVQQKWREKKGTRSPAKCHLPTFTSKLGLKNMQSRTVTAPAFFGESCLWMPLYMWDTTVQPFLYAARSETRGEIVCVPRSAIQVVIDGFSPWLAERFELFRESVISGLEETLENMTPRPPPHLAVSTLVPDPPHTMPLPQSQGAPFDDRGTLS